MRISASRERAFPKLAAAGYTKTSDETPPNGEYNCIAWAAADTSHGFWWPHPDGYWPFWLRRELTIECFVRAFRWLGYRKCGHSRREFAYEKVALYALGSVPTHMARQLRDGTWTSKLGHWEDIVHFTLDALESYGSNAYGRPVLYMRRFILVAWIMRAIQWLQWKVELFWIKVA